MIPWELYKTRSDAITALTDPAMNVEPLPTIVDCPLVQSEDVVSVTCVECGGRTWQHNAVEAQRQLESIGKRFGRRRVVIDFLDEPDWPIGTPFYACLYALYRGVANQGGRFAVCGLVPALRAFFCDHQDPLAVPLDDGKWQFRCLVHDCEFEGQCPECQRRTALK